MPQRGNAGARDVLRALDGCGHAYAPAEAALASDGRGQIRDTVEQHLELERVLQDARDDVELRRLAREQIVALHDTLGRLRLRVRQAVPPELQRRRDQMDSIMAACPPHVPRLPDLIEPIEPAPIEELRSALESAYAAIAEPVPADADIAVTVGECAVERGFGSTDDVSVALGKSPSWLRERRDAIKKSR